MELAKTVIKVVGSGEIIKTPMNFEDERNYRVLTDKAAKQGCGPGVWSLELGIREIVKVIKEGRIADVWSPEFHNAKYVQSRMVQG